MSISNLNLSMTIKYIEFDFTPFLLFFFLIFENFFQKSIQVDLLYSPSSLMPYGIVFRGNLSDNTKGVPNVEERPKRETMSLLNSLKATQVNDIVIFAIPQYIFLWSIILPF